MRKLLFLALACAGLVMFGCVSPPGGAGNVSGVQPVGIQQNESEVSPFTAKEGLSSATATIHALWSDAYLVSIYGACGDDGKASEWQYSFDSTARKKGYAVAVPGDGMIRDKPFSFSPKTGEAWVDSAAAVAACGKSGECTLEMTDNKLAWTVVSGSEVCEVDASNGKVLG